ARVRLLRLAQGCGTGAALQTGVDMACGEFIALLDPDARAMPQRLALQVAALEADPELLLVGSHLALDGAGRRGLLRHPLEPDAVKVGLLLRDCLSGVMLRREAWPQTEPCRLPVAHAYWLNARVAARGKVANVDAVLTRVRVPPAPPGRAQEALRESCLREVM